MNDYAVLTELLASILWAQGGALLGTGVLYLYSSRFEFGELDAGERRVIAKLIGWSFIWLAVGQLIGGFTGGTAAYIRENDAPFVGYIVLSSRSLSLVYLVRAVWTSGARWRRHVPHDPQGEEPQKPPDSLT